MSHYRDPLAGLRSQVALKRAVLVERERELTPVGRALLPEALCSTIDALRPRAIATEDSLEALSDADSALDGILAAHDEAAAKLPELRQSAADEIPDPARPAAAPPWLIEEPSLLELRAAVEASLLRIDSRATLGRFGDFAYVSRFRVGKAPYTFAIVLSTAPDDEHLGRFESYLRTSVPAALQPLVVRRQGVHHYVGKALGIVRELELGASEFDAGFWITGSRATTAVLTAAVRRALGVLAEENPVLRIGDGLATLSWAGYWRRAMGHPVPAGAFESLAAIRAAVARE